jgi:hypothetical protein
MEKVFLTLKRKELKINIHIKVYLSDRKKLYLSDSIVYVDLCY